MKLKGTHKFMVLITLTLFILLQYYTIRLLLAIAAQMEWKVFQLDVKSAFLNGILEDEIYVEQPSEFVKHGDEDYLSAKKGFVWPKEAPRSWYSRIDDHLISLCI